ncbi:hypothetical protein HELRODRAFT_182588 [Helobdella robusta]|uniref:C-type lectin domain-containing protein n=1 Tax=Helobdella robusta TaxID=6412 RepID=T1FIF1_HELRO|nr:hypothetical protein HELRODRAFT_182588 [Helobdella robusta]ESN90879.1 hypothetical protein HELRODRAFT_182588 [Helobdella robusta]
MTFHQMFIVLSLLLSVSVKKSQSEEYFKDGIYLNWTGVFVSTLAKAQNHCQRSGMKLLELRDERMFEVLNNKTSNGKVAIESHKDCVVVELSDNDSVTVSSQTAYHEFHYACQYKQTDPTSSQPWNVEMNSKKLRWFDARNDCLRKGGDLLVMRDAIRDSKVIFKDYRNVPYWVGLTNLNYYWQTG